MATFLDVGLIQAFDLIFPFLLTFAIVFAILQKTEVLGKSLGINATVAIAAAFMVLLSSTLIEVINFMVPWFVVAIIFFVLLILIFSMFGAKEASFEKAIKDQKLQWALIGVCLLIALAAFGNVLGQQLLAGRDSVEDVNVVNASGVSTGSFETNIYSTLFHPKVLGLIVLFAIAVFAIAFLSGTSN